MELSSTESKPQQRLCWVLNRRHCLLQRGAAAQSFLSAFSQVSVPEAGPPCSSLSKVGGEELQLSQAPTHTPFLPLVLSASLPTSSKSLRA